jgi:hypothetical protein
MNEMSNFNPWREGDDLSGYFPDLGVFSLMGFAMFPHSDYVPNLSLLAAECHRQDIR